MASTSTLVGGAALSEAIYGEHTTNVVSVQSSKVTARIVLPLMTFVDDVLTYDFVRRTWETSRKRTSSIPNICFRVDFPHEYPATNHDYEIWSKHTGVPRALALESVFDPRLDPSSSLRSRKCLHVRPY